MPSFWEGHIDVNVELVQQQLPNDPSNQHVYREGFDGNDPAYL